MLEGRDLGHQRPVVRGERRIDAERVGDQCLANEHGARFGGRDRTVRDRPARDEREAVKLYALAGDDLASFAVPVRIEIFADDAIARDRLDPVGLDAACTTCE